MPFKSEAQRRMFHAMADRGEISQSKVKEWEDKTKNKGHLPMHVKHKKTADDQTCYEIGVRLALTEADLV